MADNVAITAGSGTSIATDDVSGIHYQRVKLAYGTDGSATDVNTGSGLPISDAGGSLTVDGTVAISGTVAVTDNSGTLSVDDGAGSLTVDGTVTANAGSGTFAVSASSLPLPSGASTAAKQPALGTAGTASSDVITVQGITSMTALKVDGSAVTQPVSGTVTAQRDTVSTATLANVSSSATSVTLFSSNASAKGRAITNDSTQAVYVKWGTTASSTDYVVKIAAAGYYEFPAPLYTGRVDGIWVSANGTARVTEW